MAGEITRWILPSRASFRTFSGFPSKITAEIMTLVSRQALITVDILEKFVFVFKVKFFSDIFTHGPDFFPIPFEFP